MNDNDCRPGTDIDVLRTKSIGEIDAVTRQINRLFLETWDVFSELVID